MGLPKTNNTSRHHRGGQRSIGSTKYMILVLYYAVCRGRVMNLSIPEHQQGNAGPQGGKEGGDEVLPCRLYTPWSTVKALRPASFVVFVCVDIGPVTDKYTRRLPGGGSVS